MENPRGPATVSGEIRSHTPLSSGALNSPDSGRQIESSQLREPGYLAPDYLSLPSIALAIGEPPDGEQIGRIEETNAVLERQAFAPLQLVVDIDQSRRVQT